MSNHSLNTIKLSSHSAWIWFRFIYIINYQIYLFIDKVSVYCFRSVKFSVLSTFNVKPVLCYEVFKKWPLLSLFPGCIWRKLPYFHLTIILEPLTLVLGCFPLDIQPYRTMSDYAKSIIALPRADSRR